MSDSFVGHHLLSLIIFLPVVGAALIPPGMEARIDITITDEPPLAEAVVIISAIPMGSNR